MEAAHERVRVPGNNMPTAFFRIETTRYRRRLGVWLTEAMPKGEKARVTRLMQTEHLMYTDLTGPGLS